VTFIRKLDLALLKMYLYNIKYYQTSFTGENKLSTSISTEKSQVVGSCDLDLDPITFIYKHDLYPLKTCIPLSG